MCLYVRDLTAKEGKQLSRILKTSKTAVYLRRAQVIAFSGQGMRVQEIAEQLYLHEEYVRELIRRFNAGSFEALRPTKATGRPRKHTPEEISLILESASSRPQDLGRPYTVWSLRKMCNYLLKARIVKEISTTSLAKILHENGFSFQRTKTWKESNDPEFAAKKNASRGSTRKNRRTRR